MKKKGGKKKPTQTNDTHQYSKVCPKRNNLSASIASHMNHAKYTKQTKKEKKKKRNVYMGTQTEENPIERTNTAARQQQEATRSNQKE